MPWIVGCTPRDGVDHVLFSANRPAIVVLLMVYDRKCSWIYMSRPFLICNSPVTIIFGTTGRISQDELRLLLSHCGWIHRAIQIQRFIRDYRENWFKYGGDIDPKEHARKYVTDIRVWSNTTLVSGEMIKQLCYLLILYFPRSNEESRGVVYISIYLGIRVLI